MTNAAIAKLLEQFAFVPLFLDQLGWNHLAVRNEVQIGEAAFALTPVAEKRGVQVLHCAPLPDGSLPAYDTRQKIERAVTREVREHLLIFSDAARTTQVWQWADRLPGKPIRYREITWRKGQSGELLRQKLQAISFDIAEEDSLTVVGVAQRLRGGFDRDKVTKNFFKRFQQQRDAFERFIEGIPKAAADDRRWYTAVLINRLMFIWFLQEKGFLEGSKHYMQDRLARHEASGSTVSFYRALLCPLFFTGFAVQRTPENRAAIAAQFGEVPYLNGGLFARHKLEAEYGDELDVSNAAFDALFGFFNQWDWHLDDRPLRDGREINPDVLGHIFEKFVNQKQMGAYYTKEDITEYISKNTVLPVLLNKVRAKLPTEFDALAWPLLQADPDRYLYPAMKHGLGLAYPAEIEAGRDTHAPDLLDRRRPWNGKTPAPWALPTEIWRETIARHDRAREVRAKLASGEVRDVADLITYNLDIRQFVQDVIERCTQLPLLREFWAVLAGRLPRKRGEKYRHGLSVLDPTCGSGAFLFAALGVLKPLYDAALGTMASLLADASISGQTLHPDKWGDIEDTLQRFHNLGDGNASERRRDYAVIKHIIVNNLYGVDIEEQATEIAKLRLFLKLVALLEVGDEIEPLPDVDFNIRAGNTLVGYATAEETEKAVRGAVQGNLFSDAWEDIRLRLTAVEESYNNFQIQQVQRGGHVSAEDKAALENELSELENLLNWHMCRAYGKDPTKGKQLGDWIATHRPLHWYVDFYPMMSTGGFDAVVGNPPYLQLSELRGYGVSKYECSDCGNLYAVMLERCLDLVSARGRTGFIVPVSAISTDGYRSLQSIYAFRCTHVSCFDDRPSRLFEGLEHIRLVVVLAVATQDAQWLTTRYYKWTSEERDTLFQRLGFFAAATSPVPNAVPKMGSEIEGSLLAKMFGSGHRIGFLARTGSRYSVNYSRKVGFFVQVINFVPKVLSGDGTERAPSEFKTIYFDSEIEATAALAALNSSLFYWYITLLSDCRHLNKREVESFPLPTRLMLACKSACTEAVSELMNDLQVRSDTRVMKFKHDTLTVQCVVPRRSWIKIQRIDELVADAFGLNAEELDYVAGYDIKYRMGQEVDPDD